VIFMVPGGGRTPTRLPSADFESVFFISHQLAQWRTQKQKPSLLLWLGPIAICTPPQSAARDSGTKYHHLYPQKTDNCALED
jgi:hypothetical protein